jgi:hypothetical protein
VEISVIFGLSQRSDRGLLTHKLILDCFSKLGLPVLLPHCSGVIGATIL